MPERVTPPSIFTPVEVSTTPHAHSHHPTERYESELLRLMRDLVTAQDRQNELLEEVLGQLQSNQRQRAQELQQWKNANPELTRKCRSAAEALSQVQTSFLQTMTDEVLENAEALTEGEFMLSEFVDRFGPRLAHLNGVLQVLAQLGGQPQE